MNTDEPVPRCKKDQHDLVGDNRGVNRSTGRVFCKACKNAWQRKDRAKTCPQGHDLRSPTSYTLSASGKRRKCLACRRIKAAEQAKRDASPFYGQTSIYGKPTASPGQVGGEAGARLRLALMVRARYPT